MNIDFTLDRNFFIYNWSINIDGECVATGTTIRARQAWADMNNAIQTIYYAIMVLNIGSDTL